MARVTKIEATRKSVARKRRVAAYARVSTDSDEQLVSLETQKAHYEKYIRSRPDWEYAGLYYDEGISGTSMAKRDGLLRLLSDCDKGLIDYIVVKSISRFSRNTVESIETVRHLCSKGIYIYFEKENIDTENMEGELLLSILSGLAENESRSISENINWGIQRRFRNGTFKIGYAPYGYDSIAGKMAVNEDQAEVVRFIFSSVLSGRSPRSIAKELNEKGIPTKRHGTWTGHTIYGMIRNEKYTGDCLLQKTYTDDHFKRHKNHEEKPKVMITDHHEPIISHEVFEAANAVLERNGLEKGIQKGEKKYLNRYAMSGKVICGECGGKMKRVKIGDYFGFACYKHVKDKKACSMKAMKEEPVKAAFCTVMNKLTFASDQILLPLLETLKERGRSGAFSQLDEIEGLLEKNTDRKIQITQFFSKGLLDATVYAEQEEVLAEEERQLSAEKNSLTAGMNENHDQGEALEKLLKYTAKGEVISPYLSEGIAGLSNFMTEDDLSEGGYVSSSSFAAALAAYLSEYGGETIYDAISQYIHPES